MGFDFWRFLHDVNCHLLKYVPKIYREIKLTFTANIAISKVPFEGNFSPHREFHIQDRTAIFILCGLDFYFVNYLIVEFDIFSSSNSDGWMDGLHHDKTKLKHKRSILDIFYNVSPPIRYLDLICYIHCPVHC